jgi:hypothetical protein
MLLDTMFGDLTWKGMDTISDTDLDQHTVLGQSECHDDAIDPCYSYTRKDLDSVVMTMQAESIISYGLICIVVLGC